MSAAAALEPPVATGDQEVLDAAVAALWARREADVALLRAAAEWGERHPATALDCAGWGERDLHGEGVTPLAGPGAPLVAEFAPIELAAALGWSYEATLQLMGDALELKHRLPRTWERFVDHDLPVHLAREAARATRDLDRWTARDADRMLTWDPAHLNPTRIRRLVDEARMYADPDRAAAAEEEALAARKVEVRDGGAPGTTDVAMVLDTVDALAFDARLSEVAEVLAAMGDTATLEVRRAKAVGVLADPHRALGLLAGDLDAASSTPRLGSAAVLYLHVDAQDLQDLDGAVVTSDRLGPVTARRIAEWLAGSRVSVRPVLDPAALRPVDAHDPPAAVEEAVRLRDVCCVFPGCRRSSRRADLDHIDPYVPLADGGPPGQTSPESLAPLCRRHHRAKTHGGFRYRRLPDGDYEWTLPTGRVVISPSPGRRPPARR